MICRTCRSERVTFTYRTGVPLLVCLDCRSWWFPEGDSVDVVCPECGASLHARQNHGPDCPVRDRDFI